MNSQRKTIVFRADGSPGMGIGHIMRCAALGGLLAREPAVEVSFLCTEDEFSIAYLRSRGFAVNSIPAWNSRDEMFRLTIAACARLRPDVLCADLIDTPGWFMDELKTVCGRVAAIDDLGEGGARADALLGVDAGVLSERVAPGAAGGRVLRGPRYAIVAGEFAELTAGGKGDAFERREVLVTFGGSDPQRATAKTLEALAPMASAARVTAVLGPCNADAARVSELAPLYSGRLEALVNPPQLPVIMHRAAVAVCGVGQSLYELATLGTPAVIISQARLQESFAARFVRFGCALHAGRADAFDAEELRRMVDTLLADRSAWEAMSAKARGTFDGMGARRVCDALLELAVEAG